MGNGKKARLALVKVGEGLGGVVWCLRANNVPCALVNLIKAMDWGTAFCKYLIDWLMETEDSEDDNE